MDGASNKIEFYSAVKDIRVCEKEYLERSTESIDTIMKSAKKPLVALTGVGAVAGVVDACLSDIHNLPELVTLGASGCFVVGSSTILGAYICREASRRYKIRKIDRDIARLDKKIKENDQQNDDLGLNNK